MKTSFVWLGSKWVQESKFCDGLSTPGPLLVSSSLYISPTSTLYQLTKLVGVYVRIEDSDVLLFRRFDTVILDHTAIDAHVGALHRDGGLGCKRLDDEMVIAVRAVLVCLFELL